MSIWQAVGAAALFGPILAGIVWAIYDWIRCSSAWHDTKDALFAAVTAFGFLAWLVCSILLMTGDLP